jgi:Holliday junction resolvase RusA-like endonuclease
MVPDRCFAAGHPKSHEGDKSIKFSIPIEPEGKKEARRNLNGQVFKHPDTRRLMKSIAAFVQSLYFGSPFDGPLRVRIRAFRTRPKSKRSEIYADTKPDADNIQKLIGDALEGILWTNDSRIVDVRCQKLFAPKGKPGWIEITAEEIEQTCLRSHWLHQKNWRNHGSESGDAAVARRRRIRRHPAHAAAFKLRPLS